MTFKETIELTAALLTVIISLSVLIGFFIAHKKGFFRAVHNIVVYYDNLIEQLVLDGKNKKKKK